MEPLLMIRPPRGSCAFISAKAARAHRKLPVRLVSTTARHCATVSSSMGTGGAEMPALLKSRSSRPKRWRSAAKAASTWASSVTSAGRIKASGSVSRRSASRRPSSASVQPSRARARATARPIPAPAPVTSATAFLTRALLGRRRCRRRLGCCLGCRFLLGRLRRHVRGRGGRLVQLLGGWRAATVHTEATARAQAALDGLRLVVAQRLDHLVVRVGKRRHDDLALGRLGVGTAAADTAAAEGRAKDAEIEVLGRTFGRGNLHAGTVVDQQQRRGRLVLADAAGCQQGQADDTAATETATAAGLAGELDFRAQRVVRGHHLALAHVRARTGFAALHQRAFAHHVLHGLAALDDHKAIALLDHQADDRHRGSQLAAAQLQVPGRSGVFMNGERPKGLGTGFELGVLALCGLAASSSGHRALVLAQRGRRCKAAAQQQRRGKSQGQKM
eukprot:m.923579 g.923579  ORF g.923579 m.923579 type:complete len:446 (+) comp111198_c0_seq1:298-1635(+)